MTNQPKHPITGGECRDYDYTGDCEHMRERAAKVCPHCGKGLTNLPHDCFAPIEPAAEEEMMRCPHCRIAGEPCGKHRVEPAAKCQCGWNNELLPCPLHPERRAPEHKTIDKLRVKLQMYFGTFDDDTQRKIAEVLDTFTYEIAAGKEASRREGYAEAEKVCDELVPKVAEKARKEAIEECVAAGEGMILKKCDCVGCNQVCAYQQKLKGKLEQ